MRRNKSLIVFISIMFFMISTQAFADLVDLSASSFDQTGTWEANSSTGTFTSTNWSTGADYSWSFEGTVGDLSVGTTSGSLLGTFYAPVTATFDTGTLTFNYEGNQYTCTMAGQCDLLLVLSYGSLSSSRSTMDMIGSGSIYLNGSSTGYLLDLEASGNITYFNMDTEDPVLQGSLSSMNWTVSGSDIVTPVPVPAAVWLLGSGLLGLVGIRRKRGVQASLT